MSIVLFILALAAAFIGTIFAFRAISHQMAALAGDQILLDMLAGRIFHARFLRKIWIAHAREGAYNEN